ncbi:MAG: DUF433 domain-containing protein [Fimbriimonadaceae bacterium]|nr:DUF433 domain-containing protein [Fimbriimonadaceae bacterium]QYK59438.1 MAG: DUF433 domain-containing protein [Fimbriimonadaceae bacterium]
MPEERDEPVVAGCGVPVRVIREAVSDGVSHEELMDRHPGLTREGIEAALADPGSTEPSTVNHRQVLAIVIGAHMALPVLLMVFIHESVAPELRRGFELWHLAPLLLIPMGLLFPVPVSRDPSIQPERFLQTQTLVKLSFAELAVVMAVFIMGSSLAVYITVPLAIAAMAVIGRRALAQLA